MRKLLLDEAVWELAAAAGENRSAFFFLIGAGVSAPEIPLATAIADECQRIAEAARPGTDGPKDGLDRYSFWFERAFPQPRQRQRYLEALLRDARISHATLRLAVCCQAEFLGDLPLPSTSTKA